MKLVNLITDNKSVDKAYVGIPQPMPIYFSEEEVRANEIDPKIITVKSLYIKLTNALSATKSYPSHKVVFYNSIRLFISTGEKFKMRDLEPAEGNRVPLVKYPVEDNYIRVYAVVNRMNSIFHVYTSSGVWAIGNQGFTVTGAIAPTYRNEVQWNKRMRADNKSAKDKKQLKRMTEGKTILADDYKFTGLFLNEKSPTYLNLYASAHMAYADGKAGFVSMKQIDKILDSPRVRALITKQMRIFMPKLATEMATTVDAKALAVLLHTIATDTVSNELASVDDKLKSVQAIINVGYADEAIVLNAVGGNGGALPLGAGVEQNLIGAGYEDTDTKKVIERGDTEKLIHTPEEKNVNIMDDATFDELAAEVDLDESVMVEDSPRPKAGDNNGR
jgi:hypothetical protein